MKIERTGRAEVIQGLVRPDLRIDCLNCSGHLDNLKAWTGVRSGELIRGEYAGPSGLLSSLRHLQSAPGGVTRRRSRALYRCEVVGLVDLLGAYCVLG